MKKFNGLFKHYLTYCNIDPQAKYFFGKYSKFIYLY